MLKISNLTFSYGENIILNNLNHSFEENKIYCIMGTNGSGKSTLFNLISGFLTPSNGKIVLKKGIEEKDTTKMNPYQVSNIGISRTFQDLRLIPSISVKDNIYLAIKNKKTEKIYNSFLPKKLFTKENKILEEKITNLLKKTNLFDVKDNLAEDISYGQQKLLNLAQAMTNDFDLLLLDEPVAGVQPKFREDIIKIIKSLNKTVICIEHNIEFIEQLSTNILFLHSGKILAKGDINDIKNNKTVQKAYL